MGSAYSHVEQPAFGLSQGLDGVAEDLEQGPRRMDQRIVPLRDIDEDDRVCLLALEAVSRTEAKFLWLLDVQDLPEVGAVGGELRESAWIFVEVDGPCPASLTGEHGDTTTFDAMFLD